VLKCPTYPYNTNHSKDFLVKDFGLHFHFNGQETDGEINGAGNSYTFKFRIDDSRLGRFLSIDPLDKKYPYQSPYVFGENRVLDGVELEGKEWSPITQVLGECGINTVSADNLIANVENGIQTSGHIAAKSLTYAGLGTSIVFGGGIGIILGVPALGLTLTKDVALNIDPKNSKAENAPNSFGEAWGMALDKTYEANTGNQTNVGRVTFGFADAVATSPANSVGAGSNLAIIPSKVGQTMDASLSVTNIYAAVATTKVEMPKPSNTMAVPNAPVAGAPTKTNNSIKVNPARQAIAPPPLL